MKPILFDFGNVLCSFDYDRFFQKMARHGTMTVSELRDLMFTGAESLSVRFETGRITRSDFVAEIRTEARILLPHEEIERSFIEIFDPNEPVLDFARKIATLTSIGLVSNTNELHFDRYMRRIPIFSHFSAVSLSYKVGEMKPGGAIFRDAAEQLGRSPEDCVFVDDLKENIDAAASFGFTTIHYSFGMDLRTTIFGI